MTKQHQQDEQEQPEEDDGDDDEDEEMEEEDTTDEVDETPTNTPSSSKNHSKSRDESGESSSTSSTSDGKSRRSRGGYSADCSASDQSSDDTGSRSTTDLKLSVERLCLDNNSSKRRSSANEGESSSVDDEDDATQVVRKGRVTTATAKDAPDGEKKPHNRRSKGRKRERGSTPLSLAGEYASTSTRPDNKDGVEDDSESELAARLNANVDQAVVDVKGPLPQWSCIRIKHPMDPRIDLSSVNWSADVPVANNLGVADDGSNGASCNLLSMPNAEVDPASTLESYQRLMEVVRPYFLSHGMPYLETQARQESEETQCDESSEGFTSFFTTTHSGTSTSGANSSDQDKKPMAQPLPQQPHQQQQPDYHQSTSHLKKQQLQQDADSDEVASESSSMVVMARPKRKHHLGQEEGDTSSSSRERRVRIQENAAAIEAHVAKQPEPQAEYYDDEPANGAPENEDGNNSNSNNEADQEEPQDSSNMSSSSSSEQQRPNHNAMDHDQQRHFGGGPPHFVTDVSSSNRTDSTGSGSNTNSASGSGSGSAGNTGSGTGSGSNQGSSGSCNDNDGKGSSEDLAKEDNSGDATNEGSDEAEPAAANKKIGLGLNSVGHRHETEHGFFADGEEHEGAFRERKLLDKKRKRIEMRREYEAQQQSESSENNEKKGDYLLRPGKPVTLDQVLQFSKIPRVVAQATPPFLVVHTNAAYCRLTGIDSHKVVGKPINTLLSLPDVADENLQGSQCGLNETGENTIELAATAAGRATASHQNRKSVGLERLVVSSGFGHLHVLHVHARPHQMLGKNVSFVQDGPHPAAVGVALSRNGGGHDEGSNDTSHRGGVERHPVIRCRSSIAPVVSSMTGIEPLVVSDKEGPSHQKAKRRKFHAPGDQDAHRKHLPSKDAPTSHRKHPVPLNVSHYVIQLEPQELAGAKQGSEESLSSNSTSVEARLLGLSKAELLGQRRALQGPGAPPEESESVLADDDAAASETTDTKEHVATVG